MILRRKPDMSHGTRKVAVVVIGVSTNGTKSHVTSVAGTASAVEERGGAPAPLLGYRIR